MAEIGRDKIKSMDVIADPSVLPANYFDARGNLQWPEGISMLRAWRFVTPQPRLDILARETIDSQATRSNAILLSPEESRRILALTCTEVTIPHTDALDRARIKTQVLSDTFPQAWAWEVARMSRTILRTAANANGQEVTRTVKLKTCDLSEPMLQQHLRELLVRQDYRCKLTGQRLETVDGQDSGWLAASADRIDSDGHYTIGNIQIVSKAANMAKSDIGAAEAPAFFAALQFHDDVVAASGQEHADG